MWTGKETEYEILSLEKRQALNSISTVSYLHVSLVGRCIFTFPLLLNLDYNPHTLQSGLDHQSVGSRKLQSEQLLLQAVIKLFS